MRPRIWLEAGLGGASGFLCLLTLAWKDWLEGVVGWNPDRHSGTMEWLFVVGALAGALLFGGMAIRDHRHVIVQDRP